MSVSLGENESKLSGTCPSNRVTSLPAPIPPIHVHVDPLTPVLVHIKAAKELCGKPGDEDMDLSGRAVSNSIRGTSFPTYIDLSKGPRMKDDDDRTRSTLSKSPRSQLPPPETYHSDPELDKESNAIIKEYIEKCARQRKRECGRRKESCPSPSRSVKCDSPREINCQNEFLSRALKVLKSGRTPAGQDLRKNLDHVETEVDGLLKQFTEIEKSLKESQSSEEIAHKRESVQKKLNQLNISYKNIRKSLGISEDIDEDIEQQLERASRRNDDLICELHEVENMTESLKRQVQCEKDYNQSLQKIHSELEDKCCSLQHEMLNKTGEIEKITIQLKNLQNEMGERLAESENLQAYVETTSRMNECEKEGFRKALKIQIEKATRSDETLQKTLAKIGCLEDELKKFREDIKLMEAEADRLRPEAESKKELEQICKKLQEHLKELQPLPELLKSAEMKLKEEQSKNIRNETRVTEQAKLIAEISAKIDSYHESVRKLSEEISMMNAEKYDIECKLKNITNLYEQGQSTISELTAALQMKNDLITQLNCKLDDKDCNNMSINRQLEVALAESNRLSRLVEERAVQLEKENLGRLKDLEAQIACSKQEIKQLKLEKQDLACKYGRQMQDLREKLEQCDMATHNMQSYIAYLKTAYSSVFNDPNLTLLCPPLKETVDTS